MCALASALFVLPQVASAYWHSDPNLPQGTREKDGVYRQYVCSDCHVTWDGGDDEGNAAYEGAGPHGYYRADSSKCRMCHTVHEAASDSIALLPAATIQAACFTCHDSTGAQGVYSAITDRGGSVVASHSIETTTHVPGGTTLTSMLDCTSCHAVHRATTVKPFRTDRGLPTSGGAKYSNALLRDDVGGKPRGTYTTYSADWCTGCHDRRHSDGPVVNHPVESSTTAGAFNYGRVAVVDSITTSDTVIDDDIEPGSGLGMTNRGYVMPWPRTPEQGNHKPICQQCHEDARNVGSVGAVLPFKPSNLDGAISTDATSPAYYSFPHQSTGKYLLLEQQDDLCLNCHPTSQLP